MRKKLVFKVVLLAVMIGAFAFVMKPAGSAQAMSSGCSMINRDQSSGPIWAFWTFPNELSFAAGETLVVDVTFYDTSFGDTLQLSLGGWAEPDKLGTVDSVIGTTGSSRQLSYTFQADVTLAVFVEGPAYYTPFTFSITCAAGTDGFTDGRLNSRDIGAPVAIYCNPSGLDIYRIIGSAGGFELRVTYEEMAAAVALNPTTNYLIKASKNGRVRLYLLAGGTHLQVNAPEKDDPNGYAFIFPLCSGD